MDTVEALRKYNRWRRGGEWHDGAGPNPTDIGEMIDAAADELEHLRTELKEGDDLRDRLGDLLSRTAVALRGPEPELTRWSWHDLPERAAAAIAAIDVMARVAKKLGKEQ